MLKFLILSILFINIFYVFSLNAKEYFLLVTGCCYSGTLYTSKVLKKSGLKIGHEHLKEDGAVAWPMAVITEQVPWGDPRNQNVNFLHIFHQVRDPLKTITSLYLNAPEDLWYFVSKYIVEINQEDSRIVKCAKYWYYWNLIAEKEAEWTYKVESIDNVWEEFQERLNLKLINVFESISKDTHHKKDHDFEFSWSDLKEILDPDLYEKITNMAKRYGYNL